MKKLILLCLALCLLVCLAGCGKKDTPTEPTEEDIMSEETYTICGHPLEEYKILKSSSAIDAALILRAAIQEQAGVQLQTVSTMPKDGKAIRFIVDAHAAPGSCRIYTEGETLNIAAFDASFLKQSAEKFQTLLEGGQKTFAADFDTRVDFDRIAIADVPASATWKMVGDVDRDTLSYSIGERAYLNLAVVANGKIVDVPYFRVQTYNETIGSWNTEWVAGKNGVLEIKTDKMYVSGFYYWNVYACDGNRQKLPNMVENDMGYHFQGAAGFSVDGIAGVTECPADFDTFWFGIADEIRSMDVERVTFRQVSGQEGYIVYYIELRCGTDAKGQPGVVSAYLTYPEWASPTNQVKLRIGFQGHGRDAASPSYYEGTATLEVCAHSIDSERFKSNEDYRNEVYASIDTRFGFETAPRENMYFYQMLKRDLLGLRFLVEYCGSGQGGLNIWNGQDLIAGGGSMGGFQAMVMGALAERVTGHNLSLLNLTKPWLCDTNAKSTKRRPSAYCPEYRAALGYYDTLNFAHLITCETTIYAGLGDSTCTASAMQALYNTLTCKKSITYEQNVSHNFGAQYHGSRTSLSAEAQQTQ